LQAGYTFMLEDEDGSSEHLHLVLTAPNSFHEVITVSISTRRAKSETLVCLFPGEHPFIIRESVCLYRFAKIRICGAIELAIATGKARENEPASPQLIAKLCNGLLDSEFTPRGISAFFREVTSAS
jgi:hypothetical protein